MSGIDIYRNLDPVLHDGLVFTTLEDLPQDNILLPDGDNSLLAEFPDGLPQTEMELNAELQKSASANLRLALNKAFFVPLPRILRLKTVPMRGQDVVAMQRALAKAGFRKWGNFTGIFGKGTDVQLKKFQESKNHVRDGIYDLDTHNLLAKYYDAYGRFLMNKVNRQMTTNTPRQTMVAYAMFGYNQRYQIHYTQGALRMYGVRNKIRPPKIPYYEDCSSYSTWIYWGAGAKDPNGLGYNGFGYTGTLSQHGLRTFSPKPGDLGFYGSSPYSHVVIYVGNGMCVSHGSEGGPYYTTPYYRSDFSHWRTYTL
jgi:hypothetical protein